MATWVRAGLLLCVLFSLLYGCSDFKAVLFPEDLVAVRTRPLCLYPQVARYSVMGSIDDARNFICSPPAADTGA